MHPNHGAHELLPRERLQVHLAGRAEAQSTCARGLKQSISQLEATMGTRVASNYFTKRKLSGLKSQFPAKAGELTVLIDNAECKYVDFYALRVTSD